MQKRLFHTIYCDTNAELAQREPAHIKPNRDRIEFFRCFFFFVEIVATMNDESRMHPWSMHVANFFH